MTDEEILEVWDHVNHNQSVTDQLIEFAQAADGTTNFRIVARCSTWMDNRNIWQMGSPSHRTGAWDR